MTSSDSCPQRARELFDQQLDRPREERDAFLKEACGSDRSLEQEVRSLLEAHHEAEGFLEAEQVARALTDLTAENDDPLVGAVITVRTPGAASGDRLGVQGVNVTLTASDRSKSIPSRNHAW